MFAPHSILRSIAASLAALVLVGTASVAGATAADSVGAFPLSFSIAPSPPCAGDTLSLYAVSLCAPCFTIQSFQYDAAGRLVLTVTEMAPLACSTAPCHAESTSVRLGRFAAGNYAITVQVHVLLPADTLGAGSDTTYTSVFTYVVGDCSGGGGLPYDIHVTVGGPAPCAGCPPRICPGEPISVHVEGLLPSTCVHLAGIFLDPLRLGYPDGRLRIELRGPCPEDTVCAPLAHPFSADTFLPPQAPGAHLLPVIVTQGGCADSTVTLLLGASTVNYTVLDTCGVPPGNVCVFPFLDGARDSTDSTGCSAHVAPGHTVAVRLEARAEGGPVAGLQGHLTLDGPMSLVGLAASGVMSGAHLNWVRTADGARFVLYADHGAPLLPGEPHEVLQVFVRADSLVPEPTRGAIAGYVEAGSDSNGVTEPVCPILFLVLPRTFVCIGPFRESCDANGDGTVNVADLVRIARCWFLPAQCPDTVAARPDCNGDGAFHLDDILCCARRILGGVDTTGHPAQRLAMSFDPPTDLGGGVLGTTLVVHGATEMDGAVLRLDYPADRYQALALDGSSGDAGGGWLPLGEPGDGDLVLGLLRLDTSASSDLRVPLRLTLRPGQANGGELRVGSGSITAPDGSTLRVDLSQIATPLSADGGAPITRVALSGAMPNPSDGETRFVVSLPARADVDLSVFDLAGRRVATLWHGSLDAGRRGFTWSPAGAHGGLYFVRLTVGGEVRATRVTLRASH